MIIKTPTEGLKNELAEVVRQFFDVETIRIVHEINDSTNPRLHRVSVTMAEGQSASSQQPGATGMEGYWEQKRMDRRAAKLACYRALCELSGSAQPWGSLTGVRPTALLRQLQKRGQESLFCDLYGVSERKYSLAKQILSVQDEAMGNVGGLAVCLYIGIPFCVSRCSYCSFPGKTAKDGEMEAYTEALLMEMDAAKNALQGRTVAAAYIGGGTPTALPLPLLEKLLLKLDSFGPIPELTLEAGRPDTIDKDKLRCARDCGVNRLCINPQTMSDRTLAAIGRQHSAQDVEIAVSNAKAAGFLHINMDVIAGLPGESEKDFAHTLSKTGQMGPSSFTCHTLSIKRGSRLDGQKHTLCDAETAARMVDAARRFAEELGMEPYYLYRQKSMAGNLENVGYAKPGDACVYNIAMMDELRSVMALGVGSVGKLLFGDLIVRKPNPRDLYVYLQRLPDILEQKKYFFRIDNQNAQAYNGLNGDEEEKGTI